jgi:hypothetical protein
MFRPESVGPVSGVLQSIVFNLFSEFSELVVDCSPRCQISPHHLLSQPTFLRSVLMFLPYLSLRIGKSSKILELASLG